MNRDPIYQEICEKHASYLLAILEKNYLVKPSSRKALYQYTRMESLCEGILGSNREKGKEICLRATSLGYMNDPTEVISGVKLAKILLEHIIDKEEIISDDLISAVRNQIFVTCFSQQNDSLPMWNMYGNNGFGVSLRFDAKSIDNIYPEHPLRCLYDDGDKVYRLVKKWHEELQSNDEELYYMYKQVLPSGMNPQKTIFATLMFIVKNKYYKHEEEVRVMVMDDTPVKYKTVGSLLVPYKERYLPKEALHEIMIGPCNDPIRSQESVAHYLSSIGMRHVKVTVSEVPYQILR